MSDVAPPKSPSAKDILQTYRYKTARYTFSLPLAAGARLAGASNKTIQHLEEVGEHLGILFQVRDDELDVGEDKQTLASVVGNIAKIKKEHKDEAEKGIRGLPISRTDQDTLLSLLAFVLERTQ
jgi:geranylgeranyl pyrophosphate synthase